MGRGSAVSLGVLSSLFVLAVTAENARAKEPRKQPATRKKATIYSPLLKTKWGQRGEYAKFTPNHKRLGCWSTALAQILYYHRLRPAGKIHYKCKKGYTISEDVGTHRFDWQHFVNAIDKRTAAACRDEIARYIYFTSVVIQKDFGTGSYVLSHSKRAAAIARHYDCEAKLYDSRKQSLDQLKEIITREIDSRRPVMMHLMDLSGKQYHAAAVDGYRIRNGKFFTHINMGHKGPGNGWYDFAKPMTKYNDTRYRKIMTVKPKYPAGTTSPVGTHREGLEGRHKRTNKLPALPPQEREE